MTNITCYNSAAGALEFVEIGPDLDTIVATNNLLSGVHAGKETFPASEATEALTNAVLPSSIFVGDNFDTDWQSFELVPGSGAIDVEVARRRSHGTSREDPARTTATGLAPWSRISGALEVQP